MNQQPALPGFDVDDFTSDPIDAAIKQIRESVQWLRDEGAITPQHEGKIALIFANLGSAKRASGIARSNFMKEAGQIFESLPEPVIQEHDDVVQSEMDRIREFIEQLPSDPASVPDPEISAPV